MSARSRNRSIVVLAHWERDVHLASSTIITPRARARVLGGSPSDVVVDGRDLARRARRPASPRLAPPRAPASRRGHPARSALGRVVVAIGDRRGGGARRVARLLFPRARGGGPRARPREQPARAGASCGARRRTARRARRSASTTTTGATSPTTSTWSTRDTAGGGERERPVDPGAAREVARREVTFRERLHE